MNNLLVTGANGQLGSEIRSIAQNYPDYNFYFTDAKDLNITKHELVKNYIEYNNINIIINCAAYTAVDNAENEPIISDRINHLAVANLAKLAIEYKIKLIHISTDYVFNGTNHIPYTETDIPNPQSVYGKTKLDGELVLKKINPPNSVIIRTSWLYSRFGKNFVKTMIDLGKSKSEINIVNDQFGSPTNALDLAKVIISIIPKINNQNVELFHYANNGSCNWYEFASEIFKLNKTNIVLKPISTNEFPTRAIRPKYSVLNTAHISKTFDLIIPNWVDSLKYFSKHI